MRTKSIVLAPDSALFRPARPVDLATEDMGPLLDEMVKTVKDLNARGIAANQLGRQEAVFVMRDTSNDTLTECINPSLEFDGDTHLVFQGEGCLSIPGKEKKVGRWSECVLTYFDRAGKEHKAALEGAMAHTAQHEMDHLNGLLYTAHLSQIERSDALHHAGRISRVVGKLNKETRRRARKAAAESRATEAFVKAMEEVQS